MQSVAFLRAVVRGQSFRLGGRLSTSSGPTALCCRCTHGSTSDIPDFGDPDVFGDLHKVRQHHGSAPSSEHQTIAPGPDEFESSPERSESRQGRWLRSRQPESEALSRHESGSRWPDLTSSDNGRWHRRGAHGDRRGWERSDVMQSSKWSNRAPPRQDSRDLEEARLWANQDGGRGRTDEVREFGDQDRAGWQSRDAAETPYWENQGARWGRNRTQAGQSDDQGRLSQGSGDVTGASEWDSHHGNQEREDVTQACRSPDPSADYGTQSEVRTRGAEPGNDLVVGVVDWDLVEDDEDDVAADSLRQLVSQMPRTNLTSHGFGRKMRKLIKNGKLREALQLFHVQQLQVDRVPPDDYCYNVLIAGCGQVGYTRMAFKLYNDMKKRRLKVKHVTYTSLLNSCANSPSPAGGLRRLKRLTEIMSEKRHLMNVINYHALIKAYGRCGELQLAFETADRMLQLGHQLSAEVAAFLLQACISDQQHGFRHALLVWYQLRTNHMAPGIFLYNLLLRAALECGAGDTATFERAIELIVSSKPPDGATGAVAGGAPAQQSLVSSSENSSDVEQALTLSEESKLLSSRLTPDESKMVESLRSAGALESVGGVAGRLPDMISRHPSRGGLIKVTHLDTAEARLALLGGWAGVLQTMASDAVSPDVKTFSLLLRSLPRDLDQEECLIRCMDAVDVAPDVAFFNQLIKKRAATHRPKEAEAVLSEMERRGVQADVMTWGCLALSVRSSSAANRFLGRLDAAQVRPNVELLTALLSGAARAADPHCALVAMQAFVTHQVRPDRRALQRLEQLRLQLVQLTRDLERGVPVPPAARRGSFPEAVRRFQLRYPRWLAEVEVQPDQHPDRQYRPVPLRPAAGGGDPTGTQAAASESRAPAA